MITFVTCRKPHRDSRVSPFDTRHRVPTVELPDKLHDIVRNWQPGKYSKRFLCHLMELVHTTLKALEWYTKGKSRYLGGIDVNTFAAGDDAKRAHDKEVLDLVAAAKKFDVERYFRRLATNQ